MIQTYVPFEDGLIFESQGYGKIKKCQFCDKPAEHANCHAHKKDCPLHCDYNVPETSIGEPWVLLLMIPIYYFIKKYMK